MLVIKDEIGNHENKIDETDIRVILSAFARLACELNQSMSCNKIKIDS
jgi:hypothetical protein